MNDLPRIEVDWNTATRAQWEGLLGAQPVTAYQQHFAFGDVIKGVGGSVHRARLLADGEVIALAQFHIRKIMGVFRLATAMMGPVWLRPISAQTKAAAYSTLRRTMPVNGLRALLLMPPTPFDEGIAALKLNQVVSPYHTVLVDLSPDETALRAALDGKWRNRLKAAEKEGLHIQSAGKRAGQYGWLLEKEEEQQKRSGYRALPPGLVPKYQDAAGDKSVMAWEAKRGTDQLGGMLFLLHGQTATYHIGWTSDEGRETSAHNLLLWHAMLQLKKRGIRSLDLGGVDTDHGPGIARFKLGTGGQLHSQCGTYCLSPNWW